MEPVGALFHCPRAVSTQLAAVCWFGAPVATGAASGDALDLSGRRLIFDDEFNTLSVSAHGPGTTWTAHTPWNGDFGDATFVDPRPGFPFTVANGILRIEMRRNRDGKWQSGLLSSSGPGGTGFTAPYGYFEMRAQFPAGPGVWPAFWLDSQPPAGSSDPSVEVDVVEHYGRFPAAFNSTVTVWNKPGHGDNRSVHQINSVPAGTLSAGFHTYGVDVSPQDIVFYFDRKPIWRTPTPPEHRHGFDVLVDLGLGGGWPIAGAPNPAFMLVDYVRVYAPR